MIGSLRSIVPVAGLALIGATTAGAPAAAESVGEFYAGKQIQIAVVAAGGGYGINGQLLADHLGRHIPGKPNIVVIVKSGGGGRTIMNWLYNVAPKDGTALGFLHKDIAAFSLIDDKGVKYKADKFQWIGSVAPMNTVMFVWHGSPAKTIKDMQAKEIIMGASGKSHPTAMFPMLLNNLIGTKFKIVSGYRGSNDIFLAMERGEVHGTAFTWDTIESAHRDWIDDKKVIPIVHVSLDREKTLPDVPVFAEVMTNQADKDLAEFLASGSRVGRAFGAPPEVPADRVAALRKAFDEVVRDPAYLAAAQKVKMPVNPVRGEELQSLVAKFANVPPALVERAKKMSGFE